MRKKIYLAGKVTGEPIAQCTMKFGKVQKTLEDLGYEVVNPLEIVGDWKCPWDIAMRKCITALMQCDAVFLIYDFMLSKGALIESELAKNVNLEVFVNLEDLIQWKNAPLIK